MKAHSSKTVNADKASAHNSTEKNNQKEPGSQFADNRPEAAIQRQLQNSINSNANTNAVLPAQLKGRDHADRIYKVTVSAQWLIDGVLHVEPAESYEFPYTSDDIPTAPLERDAKRQYRVAHPNVPNGGPGMSMNVNGRALQG
jgi:hypothetical protein